MLVNVLIPIHNGEKYLAETLASLCEQSYKEWHLVAVLDRCSDGTERIITELVPQGQRTLLHVDFGNIGKALNWGLSFCESEIIIRIDSDDVMSCDRIELQHRYLMSHHEIAVIGSNVTFINDKSERTGESSLPTTPMEISRKMLKQNCVAHPSVALRKHEVQSCGSYSEVAVGAEDYDLWLRMLGQGKLIGAIPEKLTMYRIHSGQSSRRVLKKTTIKVLMKTQRVTANKLGKPISGLLGNVCIYALNKQTLIKLMAVRAFFRNISSKIQK